MNPILILSFLEKIWQAESDRKFREFVVKTFENIVNQINSTFDEHINQINQINEVLIRIEWIQLWLIITWVIITLVIWYLYISLLKRVKFLENK